MPSQKRAYILRSISGINKLAKVINRLLSEVNEAMKVFLPKPYIG